MLERTVLAIFTAGLLAAPLASGQTAPPRKPVTTGSPERGRSLYLDFGCYACHGYDGQTGNGQRLLPPRLNEQQFVLYLRAPRTLQMPAYTTKVLSDSQASDVYAYVLSLPREPEATDIPLLKQLPVAAAEVANDPFNGTWKLNVAKSKMQEATASKSELIHYKIVGDEEHFVSEAVTLKDEAESIRYVARYNDGKAYPFSITIGGKVTTEPGASTMVRKIDAWTRERFNVRNGKPVIASRRVVSKDGKTMTLTIIRLDQQGREVAHETRILEKQ